ncbi:C-type lectin domain family 4 member F-like isoform X2 [Betta splendens]|uniref:C-type lectin domain family 4 member F-like isoform X2 n=1 Tax=Betta splendens TaxID=158456 RepID=A0A9W2Y535_BETSP|nr:C-type lectin domain family 4 member F-like isoform X2 [Betta splendens]
MSSDINAAPDSSKASQRQTAESEGEKERDEAACDEVRPDQAEPQEAAPEDVSVSLEKAKLQTGLKNLNASHCRLQDDCSDTSARCRLLQSSHRELSQQHRRLQDEVQALKQQIKEGKFCPDGWRQIGSSFYLKSTERKNWRESRADCLRRGSDLVRISGPEEQEIVSKLSGGNESWIGLRTEWMPAGPKYVWKWVDGSALSQRFWAEELEATSWQAAACCRRGNWTTTFQNAIKSWICEK